MDLVRPRPLGEQIVDMLRRAIISGEFGTDDVITEEALAEQFGVSRGPIRDALKTLESQHLVQKRGRSFRVTGMSAEDLDEVYTLRAAVEGIAWDYALARPAAEIHRNVDEPLARMAAAAKAGDAGAFATADIDFHSAIVRSARRRRLSGLWDQLEPSVRMILEITNVLDRDLDAAYGKHVLLLDTYDTGDADKVHAALREHLSNSRGIVGN